MTATHLPHRAAIGLATVALVLVLAAAGARAATPAAVARSASPGALTTTPPPPAQDPFYTYSGATPLSRIAPGTVLKTRTVLFHVAGIATPITVIQLLYRSTTVMGQPQANVTSVLLAPKPAATPELVAYNSFYDSLNPDDDPSYTFAGGAFTEGHELTTEETTNLVSLLQQGYTVDVADTEGSLNPVFATGPAYGMYTLDAIRAALASPATGVDSPSTEVALMGYSGGSIATGWAAQLAPSYAPDVERRLVGATMGGVFVDPYHNLDYIEGSAYWAGVMPMAIIGTAKAYGVSLTPYLSAYGEQVYQQLKDASIEQAEGAYPGLSFAQLTKPQYPTPNSIKPFVQITNRLILGNAALPKVPLQIVQGDNGVPDGTLPGGPGIGPGDGVMVTGDVRSYAREVCASGQPVSYTELPLTHETTEPVWATDTSQWLADRFAGDAAPSDCATIAPGNSLAPESYQPGPN